MAAITSLEQLRERTTQDGNGCWIWQGASTVLGYGIAPSGRSRGVPTHRLACALAHGPAPEAKPYALHSCDVKLCCNPDHLRWGSAQENSHDAAVRRDENADYHRLTPNMVREMRALHAEGVSVADLSRTSGVPYPTLHQAVKGHSWKHVA